METPDEGKFDKYVEGLCERFYVDEVGRPGLVPGIHFRLLMAGYFERIASERWIAWRATASYETAWMMVHKFRRTMVNLAREPLPGEVEVDGTWAGSTQAGLRGSRQLKGQKAALVIVAVEKRGRSNWARSHGGHSGF